jgi:hypothetical protein
MAPKDWDQIIAIFKKYQKEVTAEQAQVDYAFLNNKGIMEIKKAPKRFNECFNKSLTFGGAEGSPIELLVKFLTFIKEIKIA